MLLVTAATENELRPLQRFLATGEQVKAFVTGMGPVAAAIKLSGYLALHHAGVHGVVNIGVAGAYPGTGIDMLDICLAKQEFLGDFGICMQNSIQDFDPGLVSADTSFTFDNELASGVDTILTRHGISHKSVNFVTVNCCTGTTERGRFLRDKFDAGCENMEGAAVALACDNFGIPCVELRCVSNMVENRRKASWRLAEATERVCGAAGIVLREYKSG